MPSPPNLTNITPPRVPLIDERTGLIAREWYRFFLNMFNLTGSGSNVTSLTDLQLGPPATQQEDFTDINLDIEATKTQPSQEALLADIAELQKQVEGLQVTPPPREFKLSRYGSFYDTTTQAATTVNTATAITFNTTDLSYGVYLGSPTSRVIVDTPGIYNFQTSIQLDSSVATAENFYLWFRVNGVDVTNSASQLRTQGNNAEIFVALNYFFNLTANDYVELMYSVSDLGVQLLASGAVAPHPGIPSIILTVSNNIGGFQ